MVDQEFDLALRKRGSDVDVMVSITKGQILCGVKITRLPIKFDNGEVQSVTMSEPDNHSSDLLFIAYDKTEVRL